MTSVSLRACSSGTDIGLTQIRGLCQAWCCRKSKSPIYFEGLIFLFAYALSVLSADDWGDFLLGLYEEPARIIRRKATDQENSRRLWQSPMRNAEAFTKTRGAILAHSLNCSKHSISGSRKIWEEYSRIVEILPENVFQREIGTATASLLEWTLVVTVSRNQLRKRTS